MTRTAFALLSLLSLLTVSIAGLLAGAMPAEVSTVDQNQLDGSDDWQPAAAAAATKAPLTTRLLNLYPYNMHLTSGATSVGRLVVRDASGVVQSGTVAFFGYDTSLISVDTAGYVHALRAEGDGEIGTWVNALLDGQPVQNTCVVRVLSQEYNLDFTELVGEHTVLYYPAYIEGEDIESQVGLFQIPLVNEYAYDLESEYMSLYPFDSARQIIELDFGESEGQRVCGISGNPFRLGWNIKGNTWQNCFLVPFLPPRSPQWFIFYHEMAHNFTWPSYAFGYGLGPLPEYCEGIASALAIAVMEDIRGHSARFPIDSAADVSLAYVIDMQRWIFSNEYNTWLGNGANFNELNANTVDGIWMHYYDLDSEPFSRRFFLPLQPRFVFEMIPLMDSITAGSDTDTRHTLFAALVGAAYRQDLGTVFEEDYHFPLVRPLYDLMYETVKTIMDREEVLCGDADATGAVNIGDVVYLVAYIFTGGPAPEPLAAADVDCDGAITIADAVYLIEYIFTHGAAPCAACK